MLLGFAIGSDFEEDQEKEFKRIVNRLRIFLFLNKSPTSPSSRCCAFLKFFCDLNVTWIF